MTRIVVRSVPPRAAWALEQAGLPPLLARLYAARGMQLIEWGRGAEGAEFFEKLRSDLAARDADPDLMGRSYYAQAIRDYPAGRRAEGRDNFRRARDWYARQGNESLKIIQRKRADHLVPQIAEAWSEDTLDETDSRHYVRQALQKLPATQAEGAL